MSTIKISKAIIPVAGWGTRRLPITKALEKCMLPIGNRPLVDYVVQDCLKAGITDLYFVVNEQSEQLRRYYGDNQALETYLERTGKTNMLEPTLPEGVTVHYIVQPDGAYGTAVPVALAAQETGTDEPVVVVMGDDFIYNADGSSEIARLIDATPDGENSMLGVEVPREDVSRYGVIDMNDAQEFIQIVEKPSIEDAPSNLINVSKYVLSGQALAEIQAFVKTPHEGEYYITDPINHVVQAGAKLKVVPAVGQFLDGGTLDGWLHANQVVAQNL
jgi:UTP--glucose-1-phosphate uridylyltransferase